MFKLIKVTGESLSPFFNPGDYVVASRWQWLTGPIRQGDVIIFRHPTYGRLIKKVADIISPEGYLLVAGSHPDSLDSRRLGPIPPADVLGKVLFHIKQPLMNP